jgi:hypothetical protein
MFDLHSNDTAGFVKRRKGNSRDKNNICGKDSIVEAKARSLGVIPAYAELFGGVLRRQITQESHFH